MTELLKTIAREVVLPWAVSTIAALVEKKLAPKAAETPTAE